MMKSYQYLMPCKHCLHCFEINLIDNSFSTVHFPLRDSVTWDLIIRLLGVLVTGGWGYKARFVSVIIYQIKLMHSSLITRLDVPARAIFSLPAVFKRKALLRSPTDRRDFHHQGHSFPLVPSLVVNWWIDSAVWFSVTSLQQLIVTRI